MLNFQRELRALGPESAAILNVTPRTITRYRKGDLPYHIQKLMRYPSLLRALADDAETAEQSAADSTAALDIDSIV